MLKCGIVSIFVVNVKSIRIGKLTLASNLVQGPLAGYSTAPFRVLTTRLSQPGFCATEMISAKDLVHRPKPSARYIYRSPEERVLSYQLSGNDPDELGRACVIVSKLGADLIDLNAGCPVNKIRSKACGSALLETPDRIYELIRAMKNHTDAQVTLKMRVAGPAADPQDLAVADAAEQAGADLLTVHGRHWTEKYDQPCRIDSIAAIKQQVSIPVFANGDVKDAQSLKHLLQQTQCDGVMIARSSVGRPWLFAAIRAQLNGLPFTPPSTEEIGALFWEHIQGLIALDGETQALLNARKFAKYYAQDLPTVTEFVAQFQSLQRLSDLAHCIHRYFK